MAIHTELFNFIVPIYIIEKKYPGGWIQCLIHHRVYIGGKVWFDDHLFRYGSMSSRDLYDKLREWENMGFTGIITRYGQDYWGDICILETLFGLDIICDWLQFDVNCNAVYLKFAAPGSLVGPHTTAGVLKAREAEKIISKYNHDLHEKYLILFSIGLFVLISVVLVFYFSI